ncbi:M15 family metallopeptidase [Dactylosporangium sp. NPDC051541]|uniref:M15 family metallopeptidase n=1 Tax=Dactylosporangium sp. NPDC051541 TaxID=3363977 RepID=UPI0037B0288C
MRVLIGLVVLLLLGACGAPGRVVARASAPVNPSSNAPAGPGPGAVLSPSPAPAVPLPPGFVALEEVDPSILADVRYATGHNFVGRVVAGYLRPRCLLTRVAAEALREVQRRASAAGYSLKVYDCYRPQRAVDDFVRWSGDGDQRMRGEFYPREEKSALFSDGYIGSPTAHSRGSTVDLTLVARPARGQPEYRVGAPLEPCTAAAEQRFPDNSIDMGTGFDCFDTLAHTAASGVTRQQHDNRERLVRLMAGGGFANYPQEWWHYTLGDEPFPDTYYDFPVG